MKRLLCGLLLTALLVGCSGHPVPRESAASASQPEELQSVSVPQITLPDKPEPETEGYVLNRSSKKFHRPDCSSVDQMKESNKGWSQDRTALLDQGYSPCQRCHP